jgi:hypothetical protein
MVVLEEIQEHSVLAAVAVAVALVVLILVLTVDQVVVAVKVAVVLVVVLTEAVVQPLLLVMETMEVAVRQAQQELMEQRLQLQLLL